jgi:hypothetical protein
MPLIATATQSAMIYRLTSRCLLVSALLFALPSFAQTGASCGPDLLKLHGLKIPHATLLRSEEPTYPTQKLCESTYTIPGKYARAAEANLIRKYGMGKLVFECCGWSPSKGKMGVFRRAHRLANGAYAHYEISMGSEETVERQWGKIGNFYITLSIYAI